MRRCVLLLFALPLVAGCANDYKVTAVSGRVTLDGKPLAKAHVHFAPVGAKNNLAPGPTSQGETDADGRFTLTLDSNRRPGAVVGKHKVYIITVDTQVSSEDLADAGNKLKKREILPKRYNQDSQLTFEVPPHGTDSANFDLTLK